MENVDKKQQLAEEKEKAAIELENKILAILLPSVGLAAFIIGLIGTILVISTNVGVGDFNKRGSWCLLNYFDLARCSWHRLWCLCLLKKTFL